MSLPGSRKLSPAASAAAPPPVEPPGVRVTSHGLLVVPKIGLVLCQSAASGGTLVLPRSTAPAARRRATITASRAGWWFEYAGEPAVVRTPATSSVSFTVHGTPWNGPHHSPRARAPSAALARASAASAVRVTIALSLLL